MNKKGFTLIELLVVISIIGLLSTLAVVALGSAREKARDSKRLADLKQMQTALEFFYADNNSYPTGSGITVGEGSYDCLNSGGWAGTGCANAYMPQVPADPSTAQHYVYTAASSSYTINASLEGTMNTMSGAIQLTPAGILDVE